MIKAPWLLISSDGHHTPIPSQTTWPRFARLTTLAAPDALARELGAARLATLDHRESSLYEPLTTLEPRVLSAARVARALRSLRADAALLIHDHEQTLELTLYTAGHPTLLWRDPLRSPDGDAICYLSDGTMTQEDPRHFALRTLGLRDETSVLDRYAFVEWLIARHLGGHEAVRDASSG
jgi:hypothetical protein